MKHGWRSATLDGIPLDQPETAISSTCHPQRTRVRLRLSSLLFSCIYTPTACVLTWRLLVQHVSSCHTGLSSATASRGADTCSVCSLAVNIAVIKYWGKREPLSLILPTNSSLSVTLSQDHLRSKTTIRADASFKQDRMWLNGSEEPVQTTGRMANCLRELRLQRKHLEDAKPDLPKLADAKLHIVSENNFPTAAGLASSASGFAALVFTLAQLFQLPLSRSELSRIARQGSGSACRSLFGGFVAWEMGQADDGHDSLAVEVAPQSHWPDLQALICVVSDLKKGTPSTAGMQRTVATSPLLQHRIKHVVPKRMEDITKAIHNKDFDAFAQITMNDSNQFHACCQDTEPPIFYMNDVSRAIVALITELNRASVAQGKGYLAAYTYDAGSNAVIYGRAEHLKMIISLVHAYFPQTEFDDRFGVFGGGKIDANDAPVEGFNKEVIPAWPQGSVKGLIHTAIGDGPRALGADESLINQQTGMPLNVKA